LIRPFTRAAILPFTRLGEKFWYESNSHIHFGEYDPVYIQRALDQSLTNGFMVGWASFAQEGEMNSVLLAIRDKCFWKDVEILREIVWYSDKTSRGKMGALKAYKEAEKFAKNNNIKKIIMGRIRGVSTYDKLDKFYQKNDFKSFEDEYIKDLKAL
tara:strand:+ start:1512 stop:1979 length:468 start_codon:yes stop_codon:yes gene_type:complete